MSLPLRHTDLRIQAEHAWMGALLAHAPDRRKLVLAFSPWWGKDLRQSPLDHALSTLHAADFASLQVNLLSAYEHERDPDLMYDVSLLNERLHATLAWIAQQPGLADLNLGVIAKGTAVAAAIRAAAQERSPLLALVCLSGRADLAGGEPLRRLSKPTLMLQSAADSALIPAQSAAYALIAHTKQYLDLSQEHENFESQDGITTAIRLSTDWLEQYVPAATPQAADDVKVGADGESD